MALGERLFHQFLLPDAGGEIIEIMIPDRVAKAGVGLHFTEGGGENEMKVSGNRLTQCCARMLFLLHQQVCIQR